jgi:hypothetical protein
VRRDTGDQTDQESRSAGPEPQASVTAMDITTTHAIKTVLHPVSDLATANEVYAAVTDPDGNVLGVLQDR